MEKLLQLDTELFLFFNGFYVPWAARIVYYLSKGCVLTPLFLFIIYLIFKIYQKRGWIVFAIFSLTIALSDQTCNLLKNSVCRYRPSHTETLAKDIHLVEKPEGGLYYGGKYGFPSAHASNTMALAFLVIFFLSKKKKWVMALAIAWSLLMAYSRIYLGVHYPLDILFGFVLGSCYALLMYFLYVKWLSKVQFGKK